MTERAPEDVIRDIIRGTGRVRSETKMTDLIMRGLDLAGFEIRDTLHPGQRAGVRQWIVVVDHVPGQCWEAHLEMDAGPPAGWEGETASILLEYVARELARQAAS